MKTESVKREAVRIWLERDCKGEKWVYVETRHFRKVVSLEEFIACVKNKLAERNSFFGCYEITKAKSKFVQILPKN